MRSISGIDDSLMLVSKCILPDFSCTIAGVTASVAVLPETKLVDGHLLCNISPYIGKKNSKQIVPCVGTKPTRRLFSSPKDASEMAASNAVLEPRRHGCSFRKRESFTSDWTERTKSQGKDHGLPCML